MAPTIHVVAAVSVTLYASANAERAVTRVRVLVTRMPHLLHEIIASVIAAQPDMELLELRDECETLSGAVARGQPDVLVVGAKGTLEAGEAALLLYGHPRLRLLVVDGNGRDAVLHELRPQVMGVDDVSPQGLVDLLRASTAGVS